MAGAFAAVARKSAFAMMCGHREWVGMGLLPRVEARKEVDVGGERGLLVVGGLVGEARHGGVEELPRGAAELGSAFRSLGLAELFHCDFCTCAQALRHRLCHSKQEPQLT